MRPIGKLVQVVATSVTLIALCAMLVAAPRLWMYLLPLAGGAWFLLAGALYGSIWLAARIAPKSKAGFVSVLAFIGAALGALVAVTSAANWWGPVVGCVIFTATAIAAAPLRCAVRTPVN